MTEHEVSETKSTLPPLLNEQIEHSMKLVHEKLPDCTVVVKSSLWWHMEKPAFGQDGYMKPCFSISILRADFGLTGCISTGDMDSPDLAEAEIFNRYEKFMISAGRACPACGVTYNDKERDAMTCDPCGAPCCPQCSGIARDGLRVCNKCELKIDPRTRDEVRYDNHQG